MEIKNKLTVTGAEKAGGGGVWITGKEGEASTQGICILCWSLPVDKDNGRGEDD